MLLFIVDPYSDHIRQRTGLQGYGWPNTTDLGKVVGYFFTT